VPPVAWPPAPPEPPVPVLVVLLEQPKLAIASEKKGTTSFFNIGVSWV
jgi:hypothetical protein